MNIGDRAKRGGMLRWRRRRNRRNKNRRRRNKEEEEEEEEEQEEGNNLAVKSCDIWLLHRGAPLL